MNILDTIATYLTKSIRKNYEDSASEEVLFYSLVIVLNTISIVLIVSIVGLFTGHFLDSIIALFAYAFLRYFSGGVHLSSSITCIVVSSLILILVSHISIPYWYTGFILNLISLAIILWLAPKGIEGVSRISPKYYPVLKLISTAIICSNFLFQSDVLCLAFITQALTLTTPVYQLVDFTERRGKHI
jgi:accessory gene regulator B